MVLHRSPYFSVWFDASASNFRTGCYEFRDLLTKLSSFSNETAGWSYTRSWSDMKAKQGLDSITQVEEIISFLETQGNGNMDPMTSFRISSSYIRHDVASRLIKYAWHSPSGVDKLTLEVEDMRYIAPVTLNRYLALADILLTWQRPRYMWVGDPNYVYKKHGLFDGIRTVANWIAWVPQTVTATQIPSAHILRPHLGGTLIITQPDFFNARDNQPAIDRANAVEYEMNEAGVLPLLTDLV